MKVKVNEGYIANHADGSVAQPGEIVEVEDAEGKAWIASGIASKVASAKARTTAKNKQGTASNKADK